MDRKARRRLKVHLEKRLDSIIASRPCGECTACCDVLTVEELQKPAGTLCRHASPAGCACYENRPKVCREYLCLWKVGCGTLEQRPDRLGVVITPTEPGMQGYPGNWVHELWPDAFRDAGPLLLQLSRSIVLLLIRDGIPKSIMGPEDVVRGMSTLIAEVQQLNQEAGLRCRTL